MSNELMEYRDDRKSSNESTDTFKLLGGTALILIGAGLILTTPAARGLIGSTAFRNLLSGAIPKDLERYLKMRSM